MTHPYSIDMERYVERIGDTGPRDANLAVLNLIIVTHVGAVPFENLDVVLGRGVSIDLREIEAKIVGAGRGGYCFEQNRLMQHVLERLGFDVQALSARVTYRKPEDAISPRTHMFLRLALGGEDWLVDVGVGAVTPTCALRLELDTVQETPHERRRIVAVGDWDGLARRGPDAYLVHQVEQGGEWFDVCEFTLEAMHPIDCELGNWFTSAHPESHFRGTVMVARSMEGGRVTLGGGEFTRRMLDGTKSARMLAGEAETLLVLESEFGLRLVLKDGERLHPA